LDVKIQTRKLAVGGSNHGFVHLPPLRGTSYLSAFRVETDMRSIYAFMILSIAFIAPVEAAELQVICPPLVRDGMKELAAAYTKQTGMAVAVRSDVMGKIMRDIQIGTPAADVVLLPVGLMDDLVKDNGVKPGTRTSVGRVEIALAVRAGAAHPDISTTPKLRAVLLAAKALAYTQPGPPRNSMEAGIIDRMLHRPEFSGVHTMTVTTGSGVSALARGDSDLALQVVPEITAMRGIELVGALPPELGAHIDTEIAVSARSTDATNAAAFIHYITAPQAAAVWRKFGLDR
jgi:molybdate transport system substrate-binding protein